MNLELYNKLMELEPCQNPPEWLMFLEICESYLKKHKIKNPVVVEIGVYANRQKPFYEQLLGARHISIDKSARRCEPDILGDSSDPATLTALKKMLRKRLIDILFIDASHFYSDVKEDYEIYSPLCNGIVALHDIETGRYGKTSKNAVYKYWDELKEIAYAEGEEEREEYSHFMFLSIRQRRVREKRSPRCGIGMIIKK